MAKAAKKRKRKYPLGPQRLTATTWFYELPGGLLVAAELRSGFDVYQGTTQTKVPWRKVCAAVDNYRAVKTARKSRSVLR